MSIQKLAVRKCLLLTVAAFGLSSALSAQESKITRSPVGVPVEVTAGQEFYAEAVGSQVPAYRLERPFKSSMGGAMGLPFSFSIDSTILIKARSTNSGWDYFVPVDRKFTASHGLLGSVLSDGDTVGLRIHSSGKQQWFVDNSGRNGYETIWTRNIKKKDPAFSKVMTDAVDTAGADIDRLIYLGVSNGLVKIRHEQIRSNGTTTRDEFAFPINEQGEGVGAVRGAEFHLKAGVLRANITVTKEMTSDIGLPLKP